MKEINLFITHTSFHEFRALTQHQDMTFPHGGEWPAYSLVIIYLPKREALYRILFAKIKQKAICPQNTINLLLFPNALKVILTEKYLTNMTYKPSIKTKGVYEEQ
jgi:hypothetical protein